MVHSLLACQLTLTLLLQVWLFPCPPLNSVFHVNAYLLWTQHSRVGRRYQQETHPSPMRCFLTTSKQQSPGLLGMSSTINCLMIDSTQWLIVLCTGFHGPSLAKHWSMVKTFKACSSPSDRSILAGVGARHKLTVSMASWSREKSHQGNDGHDPLLILQHQNHTNMAATYWTSSSCLIFANLVCHGDSIMLWALKHIQGITQDRSGLVHPTNEASL